MKTYCGLLALGLLLGACDSDKTPPDRSPATAPVDYLDAINQGKKKVLGDAGVAQVNNALRQFEAAESRRARTLQEVIAAGYLAALPALPRGMQWQYNPQTGQAAAVRVQ